LKNGLYTMDRVGTSKMHETDVYVGDVSGRPAAWRRLVPIIAVTLCVKCLVAWCFPFTGDEAYLALWGREVAWGYYDHPPVLGWLLYVLEHFGQSPLLLRSVSVVVSTVVGVGVYAVLRRYDERKAYLAFLFFMFSPANMAFFILSTDAPLMLFCFLSAFMLFKAESNHSYLCYLLCGIFLGLAFLSKYFAVLLGSSYLVYLVLGSKDFRRLKGFLLLGLGVVPFAAQNIIWNYRMGWPNLMHNLFNRIRPDSNPAVNLLCLAAITAYVLTPPVLWFLFADRRRILRSLRQKNFRMFAVASVVPLCIFLAVSFIKGVRPHWFLSFIPFIFITVAVLLDKSQLIRSIRFCIVFSLVQVGLVIAAPFAPFKMLEERLSEGDWASLVTHLHPQAVLAPLQEYKGRFVPGTTSYSISALLEYYGGERFIVFGKGSRHGRQDDMRTNFKELDGRDILVLFHAAKYDPEYGLSFERTELKHFELQGAEYILLLGYDFDYERYRQTYLRKIVDGYYKIPNWLCGQGSFFHRKYDFSPEN